MKKLFLFIVALMLVVLATVGMHAGRGRAQTFKMKHNVNDLREHGLTIVTASDPAFDAEMAKILKDSTSDVSERLEALKPLCAFLINKSSQDVVAYKLKWELRLSDGTAKTKFSSTINPARLTGEGAPTGSVAEGDLRHGVSQLIAWESSLVNILYSLKREGKAAATREKQAIEFLTQAEAVILHQIGSGATLTISLDGAFFADGLFVGPDTDNSFAEVQSYIESKNDLRRLLEKGKKEGKRPTEVLDHIQTTFENVDVTQSAHPTAEDFKAVFMKMHASTLMRVRKAQGDDYAMKQMSLPPQHNAPKLRKKGS